MDALIQQQNFQLRPGRRVAALIRAQQIAQGSKHFHLPFLGQKTPLTPQRGVRGVIRGSTLTLYSFPANIGAEPGGITRRAPGRTSHSAAAGPLSAGEGPSLCLDAALLFRSSRSLQCIILAWSPVGVNPGGGGFSGKYEPFMIMS